MNNSESHNLSKTVSHALRHEPWLYELELDDEGWVSIADLLAALQRERPEWADIKEADLHKMIEVSDKRRHEIHHGKIRALYGHSVSQKFVKICSKPPDILYHGTLPEFAKTIKQEGLRPMGRQYAHLSVDRETAFQVGLRKGPTPVVLKIEAVNAYQAGTAFYEGNKNVWLADFVGPEHIYEGSHG